jgi:hypothetical protein
MRIYLPATSTILRELQSSGGLGPAPLTGFAVTPGLRDWYAEGDLDELEYAAFSEAARASLRLLDADPSAARRRVVVVAEMPDGEVSVHDDLDRGVIRVARSPQLPDIASVHMDDADAQESVSAATTAIVAADLGDESAQDIVDDADGFELSWYATQELDRLLESDLESGIEPDEEETSGRDHPSAGPGE